MRKIVVNAKEVLRADSISDDTDGLNNLVSSHNEISTDILVIRWPRNVFSRITGNVWLYGRVSLEGVSGSSGIVVDTSINSTAYKLVFALGGTGLGKKHSKWLGWIHEMRFRVTNRARFQRLLFLFSCTDVSISRNVFDFAGAPRSGFREFGALSGGNNFEYARGTSGQRSQITVHENLVQADQGPMGSEGLGFGYSEAISVRNNVINGCGDDCIGIHACTRAIVTGNTVNSIEGRILISDSIDVKLVENKLSRIVNPIDGAWSGANSSMIMVRNESPNPRINANSRIKIVNNTLYMPETLDSKEQYYSGHGIFAEGVQDDLVISDNVVVDIGRPRMRYIFISIKAKKIPSWVGEDGNPDQNNNGVIRFRHCTVQRNRIVGESHAIGTIAVLEGRNTSTTDIIGPVLINDNIADDYVTFSRGVEFGPNNRVRRPHSSESPFVRVHPWSARSHPETLLLPFAGLTRDQPVELNLNVAIDSVRWVAPGRYRIMGGKVYADHGSFKSGSISLIVNDVEVTELAGMVDCERDHVCEWSTYGLEGFDILKEAKNILKISSDQIFDSPVTGYIRILIYKVQ